MSGEGWQAANHTPPHTPHTHTHLTRHITLITNITVVFFWMLIILASFATIICVWYQCAMNVNMHCALCMFSYQSICVKVHQEGCLFFLCQSVLHLTDMSYGRHLAHKSPFYVKRAVTSLNHSVSHIIHLVPHQVSNSRYTPSTSRLVLSNIINVHMKDSHPRWSPQLI